MRLMEKWRNEFSADMRYPGALTENYVEGGNWTPADREVCPGCYELSAKVNSTHLPENGRFKV